MKLKYPVYLVYQKNPNHYKFGLKNPRQCSKLPSYYVDIDDEVLIMFTLVFNEYNLRDIRDKLVNKGENKVTTEILGIDIYKDTAIIGNELYWFDDSDYPYVNEEAKWPRIKMGKKDLIAFIDLWLELVDKDIGEIYIGRSDKSRNKNKLALWGDGKSHEAEFSLIYSEEEI